MAHEAARGWRDPELMAVFLDILRSRPGLLGGEGAETDDLGSSVYGAIRAHTAYSH